MTSSTAWGRALMQKKNSSLGANPHLVPVPINIPTISKTVYSFGDPGILQENKLAFFCSVKCPGEPIVQAYDLARVLRDAGITVISGFQSPIEKDCLELLIRGIQPVIICPARSLKGMRLPAIWKTAIRQGRLLLLSSFEERINRPTIEISEKRNDFVVSIADQVLFAYANPGGKTEALAKKAIKMGKPVFTFESKENANLATLGAKVIKIGQLISELKGQSTKPA